MEQEMGCTTGNLFWIDTWSRNAWPRANPGLMNMYIQYLVNFGYVASLLSLRCATIGILSKFLGGWELVNAESIFKCGPWPVPGLQAFSATDAEWCENWSSIIDSFTPFQQKRVATSACSVIAWKWVETTKQQNNKQRTRISRRRCKLWGKEVVPVSFRSQSDLLRPLLRCITVNYYCSSLNLPCVLPHKQTCTLVRTHLSRGERSYRCNQFFSCWFLSPVCAHRAVFGHVILGMLPPDAWGSAAGYRWAKSICLPASNSRRRQLIN